MHRYQVLQSWASRLVPICAIRIQIVLTWQDGRDTARMMHGAPHAMLMRSMIVKRDTHTNTNVQRVNSDLSELQQASEALSHLVLGNGVRVQIRQHCGDELPLSVLAVHCYLYCLQMR